MKYNYILTGAGFCTLGVVLGAFGAHALRDSFDVSEIDIWKTAVLYQFVHSIGLIALAVVVDEIPTRRAKFILAIFTLGIILFSGSLYVLAVTDIPTLRSIAGPLTPIGGLCFIGGWIMVIVTIIKIKKIR